MKKAKPQILILDDVPEMREWLRGLIAAKYPTFRLAGVGTAPEFHTALDREKPCFALCDEVLGPGEDIASLLRVARAKGVPVALMTGMDPSNRRSPELPPGVMRRMIKPEWENGRGIERFLAEVGEVIALTTPLGIG